MHKNFCFAGRLSAYPSSSRFFWIIDSKGNIKTIKLIKEGVVAFVVVCCKLKHSKLCRFLYVVRYGDVM